MVERNMCDAVMRGIVVPPGSRATSRAQGSRRNLGYLLQYIPRVAEQAVLTRAMIKDMFWATCISISVVSAVNVLLWVWGAL